MAPDGQRATQGVTFDVPAIYEPQGPRFALHGGNIEWMGWEMQRPLWSKAPSTLPEHSAPAASPDHLKARAARKRGARLRWPKGASFPHSATRHVGADDFHGLTAHAVTFKGEMIAYEIATMELFASYSGVGSTHQARSSAMRLSL